VREARVDRVLALASDCRPSHQRPTVSRPWPARRGSHRQIPTPSTDGLSRSGRRRSPKWRNKTVRPPPSSPGGRRHSPNQNGEQQPHLQRPTLQHHPPPSRVPRHRRHHGARGGVGRSDVDPTSGAAGPWLRRGPGQRPASSVQSKLALRRATLMSSRMSYAWATATPTTRVMSGRSLRAQRAPAGEGSRGAVQGCG
jgi:hypothetical protein